MLLQSGELNHFLSNGIRMKLAHQGAISYDLSGQVSLITSKLGGFFIDMDIFQASISMWSKVSDSTVNNQIAYFMTQSASLQLLDLPSFSQDTKVDTKVRSTQFCN